MNSTQFKKGSVPWNKNLKGIHLSSASEFKKGRIATNKKEYIKKVCKCGTEFSVKPSLDRVQSCSVSCGQKGKTGSERQKEAARETAKNLPKFQRGCAPWNKGNKGFLAGENHYNYKKDRSTLKDDYKDRGGQLSREWGRQIKNRDGWKCKIFNGDCSGRVEAHHILSWKDYPELRYTLNNGITLCHAHHPRVRAEEKRLIPTFLELVSVSNG